MADPGREAYEAAERLVREAHARAEAAARAAARIPPAGWAPPREEGAAPAGSAFPDLTALTGLLEVARGAVPPELARQLADALHDLLLALRAVLDYSIARLEAPPAPERRVEDIPID